MSELAQIHRNLGHAPAGSVYSALRRAYQIETNASDLEKLKFINQKCKAGYLYTPKPNRYREVLSDHCVLSFDIVAYVMFIRKIPILHVVCRQRHLFWACVLLAQDSHFFWSSFMSIWVVPYLGVPFNLWVDQAKAFLSTQFTALDNYLGCNLISRAVEAHWSLLAERYHDPLRRIGNELIIDHPSAPLSLIIDYSNLALSQTTGSEGFTPAILTFGAQPSLTVGNNNQMPQTCANIMDLMQVARKEYEAILSTLHLRRALHSATPNDDFFNFYPGDEVWVYSEKTGWDSPYTFLYRDGQLSIVRNQNGYEHMFHSTMVKPYTRPYIPISDLIKAVKNEENSLYIYLIQIREDQFDPRLKISMPQEFDEVLKKGGVVPFDRSKLPPNANIIRNRIILTIKNPGTNTERLKARWTLMGHIDQLQNEIDKNSLMVMRMTFRFIFSC